MNKSDLSRDLILVLLIVAFGVVLGYFTNRMTTEATIKKLQARVDNIECTDTLTADCLQGMLDRSHIKFSYIVMAQAKLESSSFTSDLTKTHNNVFGMKVPASRFTFATNWHDYGSYAKYESIQDCVYDYKAWQMQCAYLIHDEANYFELLGKTYAQDPEYVNKLKQIISENNEKK